MYGSFRVEIAAAETVVRRTRFASAPIFYIALVLMILSPWYFSTLSGDLGEGVLGFIVAAGQLLAPLLRAIGIACVLLWVWLLPQRLYALRIVRETQL